MQERKLTTVLSMASEQDVSKWERLDDVIMGGQSSSTLRATEDGAALFSGDLILEGGGFCGARTKAWTLHLNLSASFCACNQSPSLAVCSTRTKQESKWMLDICLEGALEGFSMEMTFFFSKLVGR